MQLRHLHWAHLVRSFIGGRAPQFFFNSIFFFQRAHQWHQFSEVCLHKVLFDDKDTSRDFDPANAARRGVKDILAPGAMLWP